MIWRVCEPIWPTKRLEELLIDVVPPSSTPFVSESARASALRLSPVPLVLLLRVNVSPAAGAPEIVTCAPLIVIGWPAVYVNVPAPLME